MDDDLDFEDLEERLAVEIEMRRQIHLLSRRVSRLEEMLDNLTVIALRLLGKKEEGKDAHYRND